MANSVSFDAAIFRFTDTGDTESSIPDAEAIGMDYGITEASDIGVISFKPVGDKRKTNVGNPFQQTTTKPDTGIEGTQYQLQMVVNEKLANSKAIAKLFKWYFEDNFIRSKFRGRIGLRATKFQGGSFDVIPDLVSGFKIVHVEAEDDLAWGGYLPVTAILEYLGPPTQIVTRLTTYIGV